MSEPMFQNASHLLEPNPAERSYGVSIVDLAGDGRPQILVATVAGKNRLYRWNAAEGLFRDVAPPLLADAQCSGIGVACADADGSGRLSPYLMNTSVFLGADTDPDRLLLNRGGLKFEDALEDNLDCNHGAGRSVCWLDVFGDERYFAFVANYGAPSALIGKAKGQRFYRNFAPDLGLDKRTGGRGLVAQPIFGGPLSDIFCVNENSPNFLYRNDGDGHFTELAASAGVADPTQHGRGVCVADLNRDGLPDLIWGNWEGEHRVCLQQADGFFRPNCCTYEFALPSRIRTVIIADFDNDGWDEIFLNNLGEPNRLYRYQGRRIQELDAGELTLEDGFGTGAAVGDLTGNGFLDLYVAHGESGGQENALFLGEPNDNHWLRVQPLTRAGAPAIGATVRAEGIGELPPQLKFIDGGSGYLCQMEPIAHFGLGAAREVNSLTITWPTGAKKELRGVSADQLIQVPHP